VEQLREQPAGVDVALQHQFRAYAAEHDDHTVTGFETPTRRVEFYSERLAEHGYPPVPVVEPTPSDPEYPLTLTCAKNGYFCHSQHRALSSLRRRSPEPLVYLHPDLAARRGITDGQYVRIRTAKASVRMKARLDPSMRPDIVVAEYGWWQETPDLGLPGYPHLNDDGPNYNLLSTDDRRDPISGSVPLRSIPCDVHPDEQRIRASSLIRDMVVADTRIVATDTVALRLEPIDGQPLPDFLPGQHLTVSHGGDSEVTRNYSLTGPAVDPGRRGYDIAVRKVPGGRFSTAVHDQFGRGTVVHAAPPSGVFVIPVAHSSPIVLIAAGVGITPFLSYLETLRNHNEASPEVVLFYGNRDLAGHVMRERIAYLDGVLPNLKVVTYYSQPDHEVPPGIRLGRFDSDHVEQELIERKARFYICGPEAMLEQVTTQLVRRGAHRFTIFAEKFHAATTAINIDSTATETVTFARTGVTTRWQVRDGTLLHVAEKLGLKPSSGCRVGQCESCLTTILHGSVAHLVSTPDDLPPDQCLTCQSIPTSDLVLDL
jgi:ferredoxin-NADP reductase